MEENREEDRIPDLPLIFARDLLLEQTEDPRSAPGHLLLVSSFAEQALPVLLQTAVVNRVCRNQSPTIFQSTVS